MPKFSKAVDIWSLSDTEMAKLAIGQWVYAGERSNAGRFYGVGPGGVVVAWSNNARGRWSSYHRALRDYGATVRARPLTEGGR